MRNLLLFSLLLFAGGCSVELDPGDREGEDFVDFDPNPGDPNSDADCDGIPDWEEERKVYPGGGQTNVKIKDTDGDGILDGIEVGRSSSPDPRCEKRFPKGLSSEGRTLTNPTLKDSDCDGLADGGDKDDGDENDGEDRNKNGFREENETDPSKVDTDGDGLWDGLELGVTRETAADAASCPNTKYDADPGTTTKPLDIDSDGDGMPDGMEDANRNGRLDADEDETPPNVSNEEKFGEVVRDACSANNLVPIEFRRNLLAQIALGLPVGFANSYVDIQRGNTRGLMGFDASRNVAFVAWRQETMTNLDTFVGDEIAAIAGEASDATTASFTSWDAEAPNNAHRVRFSISGSMSPAARVNDIAARRLGAAGNDVLTTQNSSAGPVQHVRAQYVRRSANEVIVVMAVALNDDSVNGSPGYYGLMDVAGGAALARYFDRTVVQCEKSEIERGAVDFLFVVDDSGSMLDSQGELGRAGDVMAAALNSSTLDWRVALVTSAYHTSSTNRGIVRGFTQNVQEFQAWLRQGSNCNASTRTCSGNWAQPLPTCGGNNSTHGYNGGCWIGINGNGIEGVLGAARLALRDMNRENRFREEAEIVVIFIGDAEDQTSGLQATNGSSGSWEPQERFSDFFQGRNTVATQGNGTVEVEAIRPGRTIYAHAISCPVGQSCNGETSSVTGATATRIQHVVNATGGFWADIRNGNAIEAAIEDIVANIIGSAGVRTKKPFIGASLRVAIETPASAACNKANVPRDRQNGFDYDGFNQTVTFHGNCRPPVGKSSSVAVSYRAWEVSDESRLPCEGDVHFDPADPDFCQDLFACDIDQDRCVCPNDCGGCSADLPVCIRNQQECRCGPDIG